MITSAARKFTLHPFPPNSLPAHNDAQVLSASNFSLLKLSRADNCVYKFIYKRVAEFVSWHEAEIMAACASAYICPLLGFTETPKHFVLKMPHYRVSDLLNYMNDNDLEYMPLDKAILYSTQLMQTVAFLHAHRVAHRDIKLDNIMLSDDLMSIRLGDFGFAVAMFAGGHIGSTCSNIGTMKYLSPELIDKFMKNTAGRKEDEEPIEEKMFYSGDVWATGASMYTMYTGDYLFDIMDLDDEELASEETEANYQEQVRKITDLRHQGLWIKGLFASLPKKSRSFERSPAFENVIRNSLVTRWTMRPLAQRLHHDLVDAIERQ